MQASQVSARLRRAGFGVVSTRNREGIRVSKGALPGEVRIAVDIDRPSESGRAVRHLQEWLTEHAPTLNWRWSGPSSSDTFTLAPVPKSTPESRAAERDAIAAQYGPVPDPMGFDDEPDGAPYGAHLVTDPYDSSTNRLMEMDLQAQRVQMATPERSVRVQRKLNDRAQQHAFSVRHAMAEMCTAVYDGKPPRQQDIDRAKQQLDALITLAQDWAR